MNTKASYFDTGKLITFLRVITFIVFYIIIYLNFKRMLGALGGSIVSATHPLVVERFIIYI